MFSLTACWSLPLPAWICCAEKPVEEEASERERSGARRSRTGSCGSVGAIWGIGEWRLPARGRWSGTGNMFGTEARKESRNTSTGIGTRFATQKAKSLGSNSWPKICVPSVEVATGSTSSEGRYLVASDDARAVIMDVDKLFKLPALPASAGQKRKFTDAPSPGQTTLHLPPLPGR